jgi:peptide-methionine (S)-S-oxide reductase
MEQPSKLAPTRRWRRLLTIIGAGSLLVLPANAGGQTRLETAVLAGGCFWGVQNLYEHVKGVRDAVSGYAGGSPSGMTRSQVNDRGFAEAVRIRFDPSQISYDQLLQIFFDVVHDPTQVDRQGPDVGTRYRSAIFPQDAQQRSFAQQYLSKLRSSGQFSRPIATRLESGGFEVAEPDQQDYVRKHMGEPYVVVNDLPKLEQLKRLYPQFWRS